MGLSIEIDTTGGVPALRLAGELDIYTVPSFNDAVRDAARDVRGVVVDLDRVDLVDSSGLGALLRLTGTGADERPVALVCGDGSISKLLELTGLRSRFLIAEDLPAARAMVQRGAAGA